MNKKVASAALAASIAGGAAFGGLLGVPTAAFGADETTATAQAPGAPPAEGEHGQWVTDALGGLVANGTINQEQSDAVKTALDQAKPDRPMGGPGGEGGGPGGPGGGMQMSAAAEVLGMSADELRTATETKSLADIAAEKGVNVQQVIDALVAAKNASIDTRVAPGDLTQEQGDAKKADVVQRVTDMVNNVRPAAHHGRGGPRDEVPASAPAA